MSTPNYIELFRENERRNKLLFEKYDPERGINSPVERFEFRIHPNVPLIYLPLTMKNIPFMEQVCKFKTLWDAVQEIYESEHEKHLSELISDIATERIKHDFEFWAYTCVDIQDKITKKLIDFILNKPQRKLLGRLERMRLEGRPIRYILLKARQWGGSTLTQLYMAWIQLFHMTRWHSAIVTDVEQQANNIRGMYSTMALNHPKDVMDVELRPYQGSTKNKTVTGRDNAICVGSMQQPDNLRSFDFAMVHVSEVGLFKKTKGKSPEDLVQSLTGTIPDVHLSLIALESTAKGVGNFFHTEWLAAKNNLSGYEAIFVAWFEIEMYWKKITNGLTRFVDNMTEYDWFQWRSGATLEGINWYKNHKRNLHWSDWRMQSEFPTNDIEAFGSTGRRAFAPMYVQRARQYNRPPEYIGELRGDAMFGKEALNNITFEEDSKGSCKIWAMPDNTIKVKNRYLVSVDIGGRTDVADYSVIRVFDRLQLIYGGVPEAILTWRGHLDQDLVIWKAAQIGKFYNDALLAPETNSLRAKQADSEGDHIITVLDEILPFYPNIYMRTDPEKVRAGAPARYGFHTNPKTKTDIINTMNRDLREEGYIEYDSTVCDEYDCYEIKPDGSYGAVEGQHDDLAMCTMIGKKVSDLMPLPVLITEEKTKEKKTRIISEASF